MEIDTISIQYQFVFADHSQETFYFFLDAKTLHLLTDAPNTVESERPPFGNTANEVAGHPSAELHPPALTDTPNQLPAWTRLAFHQCPHCPLSLETHSTCPLAANLVQIVTRLDRLISYDAIHLNVITEERVYSYETTVQTGISSLMGLLIATSGCPHTSFFKPMARFHLPMATAEETIYRAASMYLLAQYFLQTEGQEAEWGFEGLKRIYEHIHIVNKHIAERLRDASTTDSFKNAVVVLDMYAFAFTDVAQENIAELRYLFSSFLPQAENLNKTP